MAHVCRRFCRETLKQFGRPGHRWEDDVKMYIKGKGWRRLEWINLV